MIVKRKYIEKLKKWSLKLFDEDNRIIERELINDFNSTNEVINNWKYFFKIDLVEDN